MNLNRVFLIGRLTNDIESRTLPSGQAVVSFGLATNRTWKDQGGNKQEVAEFHNIVAFGKLAEICANYLKKGQLVFVEGRIQTRSWQGQDGAKKYRTEIIMQNMQMGPKAAGNAVGGNMTGNTAGNAKSGGSGFSSGGSIPVVEESEIPQVEEEINVKDIPF